MKWRFVDKLLNENSIPEVEKQLGVVFPEEFKTLVIEYNHGSAFPDTFDTEHLTGKMFGELLNFNLNGKNDIIENYSWIADKLPKGVYPFSVDPSGNYLCFDYRKDTDNPSIVFWDHEQQFEIEDDELIIPDHQNEYEYYRLEFVASHLQEFFDKLYGDEEEEVEKKEVIWENFMDEEKIKWLNDENLAAVNRRRKEKGLLPITR